MKIFAVQALFDKAIDEPKTWYYFSEVTRGIKDRNLALEPNVLFTKIFDIEVEDSMLPVDKFSY